MPTQLDEISFKLGKLDESSSALSRAFDQHCKDDDRRHEENQSVMHEMNSHLSTLTSAVTPLISKSRWRVAALALFGLMTLTVLGWLVSSAFNALLGPAFGKLFAWLFVRS